jgi:MFS family permease
MELDELKQDLQHKLGEGSPSRSAAVLENYMHQRTQSVIGKVKRNMTGEIIFSLVLLPVFTYLFFYSQLLYMRFFMGLGSVFCALFIGYLIRLYKKIQRAEATTPTIRENLQQVITIIQAFTRIYFQLTMIMLPVAFIAGMITGYADITSSRQVFTKLAWRNTILYYVVFFALWSVLMYFFTRWFIKKLYGNYLQQLTDQLKELENG